jgi:hypothetical protein
MQPLSDMLHMFAIREDAWSDFFSCVTFAYNADVESRLNRHFTW